jgi:nicotinamide mononucleotide transporter
MKQFLGIVRSMNLHEKLWFGSFSAVILLATAYFSYTGTNYQDWWSVVLNWFVSPVSALTGVVCVVLCAKGHISNWTWGLVNSLLYGSIALTSGYYGDWLLNWFFFMPIQIVILYSWMGSVNKDGIVTMKRLTINKTAIITVLSVGAIVAITYALSFVDNWFIDAFKRNNTVYGNLEKMFGWKYLGPALDATTVVLQIVAEIMLVRAFAEQWILWILVNVASILIWIAVIITDASSMSYAVPTMLMWVAFLVNSCYGAYVWYKNSKKV